MMPRLSPETDNSILGAENDKAQDVAAPGHWRSNCNSDF